MKNKKAVMMLTVLLAVGTISPMAAYGAGADKESTAVSQCVNPGECGECSFGECPVCTSSDCTSCGGTIENGICTDCKKEQHHSCRDTECVEDNNGTHHSRKHHSGSTSRGGYGNGHHSEHSRFAQQDVGSHHSQSSHHGNRHSSNDC